MNTQPESLIEYRVWDRTTRLFHWINVLCVLGLIAVGTVILNAGDLGVPNDGKIALKTAHVTIGYVFVANLFWRLIWGFIGGPYSRWSKILPCGKGYFRALAAYIKSLISGKPEFHIGHNPLGRIAITALMLALLVQGSTGLILAGTDVYMPPFGQYFTEWVAGPDMDPTQVKPYAPETVNKQSYDEMREFRAPVIKTHVTTFYILLTLIFLHIAAVIVSDIRDGGSIISAMFTGRKTVPEKAANIEDDISDSPESSETDAST